MSGTFSSSASCGALNVIIKEKTCPHTGQLSKHLANIRNLNEVVQQLILYIGAGELINPTALRKAKIVCNFGLSECNRVNDK